MRFKLIYLGDVSFIYELFDCMLGIMGSVWFGVVKYCGI